MYTKDTVFILGAGASWHYGYPTGEVLIEKIIAKAQGFAHDTLGQDGGNLCNLKGPTIHTEQNKFLDLYSKMGGGFKKLAERLSTHNPLVIDYFLGQNADLKEIGTLMIAWVILEHEYENSEVNLNRSGVSELQLEARKKDWRTKDDWIKFIIHEMMSGCRSIEDLMRNKVQFITFNYDVSLESHLYKRLSQVDLFKADGDKIKTFISERVLHVYGQVRHDFEQDIQSKPYKSGYGAQYDNFYSWHEAAHAAVGQLKTIEPHNKEIDEKASVIISNAEDLYILGYGFDKNNNERLKFKESIKESSGQIQKRIFWTNYDNRNKINKIVAQMLSLKSSDLRKCSDIPDSHQNNNKGKFIVSFHYEQSIKNAFDALANDFD
jgi:hypothetical protein